MMNRVDFSQIKEKFHELTKKLFREDDTDPSNERPHSEKAEAARAFTSHDAMERYDELKSNLLTRHPYSSVKSIMFTSCAFEDGVSTTAVNFAAALARDPNTKVLLLGANLRTSKLQEVLESQRASAKKNTNESQLFLDYVSNGTDLTASTSADVDVTTGKAFLTTPMGEGNLQVIPCGDWRTRPVNYFESPGFNQELELVREEFDYVVVDAPPVHGSPETLILASKVDGIVLVVKSEKTRREVAIKAKKQLEAAGGKILGVVMNKRKYYIPEWIYRHL
jgi:capsular exopolysaccharide synthesis family protein